MCVSNKKNKPYQVFDLGYDKVKLPLVQILDKLLVGESLCGGLFDGRRFRLLGVAVAHVMVVPGPPAVSAAFGQRVELGAVAARRPPHAIARHVAKL